MDPGYLKYLSSLGVDPTQYIEMQANYLRLLANCYGMPEKAPEKPSAPQMRVPEERPAVKLSQAEFEAEEEPFIQEVREEVADKRKRTYDHDEIPVRSVAMPFEKLLEEEMKKAEELKLSEGESKNKHTFLKRKSQNIKPTKEVKDSEEKKTKKPKVEIKGNNKEKEVWGRSKSEMSEVKEESFEDSRKPFEEDLVIEEKITEQREIPARKHKISAKVETKEEISIESESPKNKQIFLKRGEGKLCTKVRSASSIKLKKKDLRKSRNSDSLVIEDSKDESSEGESRQDLYKEIPKEFPKDPRSSNSNYERYKKLTKELEEKKARLEKDALEFYRMRETEVKSLENWKQEEMKKIMDDKKRISKSTIENRANNDEIERLKREISSLKSAINKSEDKHKKAIDDLKDIIESLSLRNKELERLADKSMNSGSDSSINLSKPSVIKNAPVLNREGTPKFLKPEVQKETPTFTFKLPDKKTIENRTKKVKVAKPEKHELPVIEINLEDSGSRGAVQEVVEEGKTHKVFEDGKKEIVFNNGVKKEIFPDGFVIVHFNNKDKKETFPDGKIVYHFFENKTIQTTFPDGLQLFQFHNGQTEKHFSDGTKEIRFPDGTIKCIFNDGEEESIFPDGTVQKIDCNGVKVIEYVNGMKDTVMPDGSKVRQFPDGKIKKTNPNGKSLE